MDVKEIVERAKSVANIESDYALAKVLDVNNGDIAHWKKGSKHPSIEAATKLAILAKLPEMEVIAHIELLTAKTEEKKKFWRHYIESRGIAACGLMTALALSISLAPMETEASVLHSPNYGGTSANFSKLEYTLCAQSIRSGAPDNPGLQWLCCFSSAC